MNYLNLKCPGHPEASLEGFLLTGDLQYGKSARRPAVIVCPGGGYVYCCAREAEPVAMAYAAEGFHTFVLRYSVGMDAAGFAPLQELSWAIGLLREHAEEWNIFPDRIAVCGFSAGGHLALASGILAENRPNALILGYPAVSAPNLPGMDFMLKVLTGKLHPEDADAEGYELVHQISKDTPPVFLTATVEDALTAYGALPVAQAYSRLGLPYELHIFQFGPHGYALGTEASADGSSRQVNDAFAQWHGLSVKWLKKILGEPELEDKNVGKMNQYIRELGL